MKIETIELKNVELIGIVHDIPYAKGPEECPKAWGEYVERIVKPVYMEGREPDEFQCAAVANNVGSYALCQCDLTGDANCATCEASFAACPLKTFTYIIGGFYMSGPVPDGMKVARLHDGKWMKFHFEGGMKAFQQQAHYVYKEWLPAHPEVKIATRQCMEWYDGTDIQSPDYRCGVMFPVAE